MAVQATILEGLTNAEFGKAERLFRRAGQLQVALVLVSAMTIFFDGPASSMLLAMIATALFLMWAACDWFYRGCRDQAERGRRALLIVEGLGGQVSPGELREIEAGFSVTPEEGSAAHNPNFFASNRAVGNGRLLDLIEESAFYSCRLYSKSAEATWLRFAISIVACVGLFISSVMVADSSQLMIAARLLCTVLVFIISQEVMGCARDYRQAHEALIPMQARIRSLRAADCPSGDLLVLLGDYNSAVEGAPMMATGVYKANATHLDDLWRRHQEAAGAHVG